VPFAEWHVQRVTRRRGLLDSSHTSCFCPFSLQLAFESREQCHAGAQSRNCMRMSHTSRAVCEDCSRLICESLESSRPFIWRKLLPSRVSIPPRHTQPLCPSEFPLFSARWKDGRAPHWSKKAQRPCKHDLASTAKLHVVQFPHLWRGRVHVLKGIEGRCVLCYCMSVCISVRAHLLLCAFLLFVCVCLCVCAFVCFCIFFACV